MAEKRIVKLSSSIGEIFEVDEAVALESQFVRNVIEDVGIDSPIPLPNVSSEVLGEVLDYCKCYVENQTKDEDLLEALEDDFKDEWPDAELVKAKMDHLYDLIMVANYMHIETLLHVTYHSIAMMIAKKTIGKIRQIFNFGNDFPLEEGCLIRKETQILASFIESLPTELKIKIKVGQRFHHGEWSPWWYDVDTRTLSVQLANLNNSNDIYQQIVVNILLHMDIGLVKTLVLQTCCIRSLSPHLNGGARIEWTDQVDMNLFKDLIDGIDMSKIENLIFNDETITN